MMPIMAGFPERSPASPAASGFEVHPSFDMQLHLHQRSRAARMEMLVTQMQVHVRPS